MTNLADRVGLGIPPNVAPERRWSSIILIWRTLLTVGVLALFTAGNHLLLAYFGVQYPTAFYLISIIFAAIWFGLGYGILAAVCSTVLLGLHFRNQTLSLQVSLNENLRAEFIFVSAALLVGSYADFAKPKVDTTSLL